MNDLDRQRDDNYFTSEDLRKFDRDIMLIDRKSSETARLTETKGYAYAASMGLGRHS